LREFELPGTLRFAMPQTPPTFETGVSVADIDPSRPRFVETPWGAMALYRVGDEVLCGSAFCPHLEGPLFEGTLSGASITCPWHQWRFDLRSGRRVAMFDTPLPGPRIRLCKVELDAAGRILLHAPESD